jgi:hypothetical protein
MVSMKRATIFSLFFLITLLVTVQLVAVVSASSTNFAPAWMKSGTFAQYKSQTPGLTFVNGTDFNGKGRTGDPAILLWTCIEQNDTAAKLQVQLDFMEGTDSLHLNNTIFVDLASRSVYLMNGTLIGTTRFWSIANPAQGENPIFWDFPPEKVVATIDSANSSSPLYYQTIQGVQKFYFLSANGTIRNESYVGLPSAYDFDTGIGLTVFYLNEPMLLVLGVKEVIGAGELTSTNIDLGPREISFDIRAVLPFIAVIAAVLIVFLTIYIRLKRRKR